MSDITISNEQFESIKFIIEKLSSTSESIAESNISEICEDFPDVYENLVELKEIWESNRMKECLDTWADEIDN